MDGVKVLQFHRPVGQYLLQRPHAALDISWPVHLSQTASAAIGTACRNLHPEVDFLQRDIALFLYDAYSGYMYTIVIRYVIVDIGESVD